MHADRKPNAFSPWRTMCIAVVKNSNWLLYAWCCRCVSVALQHLRRPPCPQWAPSWAAAKGSSNHSAGCTLFAQKPVIVPLSRVGLFGLMTPFFHAWICNFLLQDTKSLIFYSSCFCFYFYFLFLQVIILFYSDNCCSYSEHFFSISLSVPDNQYFLLENNVLRCVVVFWFFLVQLLTKKSKYLNVATALWGLNGSYYNKKCSEAKIQ